MNIKDIHQDDQRTKDWRIERLGKFTGSRISDLMVSGKKKDEVFGSTAKALIYEVMAERDLSSATISDESIWDKYLDLTTAHSKPMQFGTDNEQDAIDAFEDWLHSQETIEIPVALAAPMADDPVVTTHMVTFQTSDLEVLRGGSQDHPSIANFSASPDAVVYCIDTGEVVAVVETKVPLPKTYMLYRSEVRDADSLKAVNPGYYYQTHAEMMVTVTTACFFVCYEPFLIHSRHIARIDANPDTIALIEQRLALAEEYINNLSNE